MRRILAFAVCGLSLGACTSSDLFRLDHPQVTLRLESEPPGADAKVSTGATCKTPCALPVEGNGELTVTYTLEGYQPQEVAVQILPALDPREGPIQATPNPVLVQLEAAPKPPTRGTVKKRAGAKKPAAKKPAAKKRPAKKPAAKKPAAKQPAAATPAPEPPPAAAAPAPAAAAPPPMPTTPPPAAPPSPWPPAPSQSPAKQ